MFRKIWIVQWIYCKFMLFPVILYLCSKSNSGDSRWTGAIMNFVKQCKSRNTLLLLMSQSKYGNVGLKFRLYCLWPWAPWGVGGVGTTLIRQIVFDSQHFLSVVGTFTFNQNVMQGIRILSIISVIIHKLQLS